MVGGRFAARIRVIDETREEAGWLVGTFFLHFARGWSRFFL